MLGALGRAAAMRVRLRTRPVASSKRMRVRVSRAAVASTGFEIRKRLVGARG